MLLTLPALAGPPAVAPAGLERKLLSVPVALLLALLFVAGPGLALAAPPDEGQDDRDRSGPSPSPPEGSGPTGGANDPLAPAPGGAAGTGSASFRFSLYHNDDSGEGNPFLDEESTVYEAILVLDYNVTDRLAMHTQLAYDYVSAASIERLSNYPEQSGASRDDYYGAKLGAVYEVTDDLRIGGRIGGSTEYDYRSVSVGGDVAMDLASKDTTLKWSLDAFRDTLKVIRFDGKSDGDDERFSVASSFVWYQILTRTLHGEVGTTLSYQDGFLETPYNAAVIEDPGLPRNPALENRARGYEITEELPGTRLRHAVFGRVRAYVVPPRIALEMGGRLYWDTWGIYSVAAEPRLYAWLVARVLRARLRYRFYIQTPSRHWDDHFTEEDRYRTQDSDLGDFYSNTLGASLTWRFAENMAVDLGGDYVLRSDGIDQILGTIGWRWDF